MTFCNIPCDYQVLTDPTDMWELDELSGRPLKEKGGQTGLACMLFLSYPPFLRGMWM